MDNEQKSKFLILVVEDESLIAEQYRAVLKNQGYSQVKTCNSGELAIEISNQETPDLIIMDHKLKGDLNGMETLSQIRKKVHCPVIFISAFANSIPTQEKFQLPDTYYVDKPINNENLVEQVNSSLGIINL
ncbi:MAG: response regulator [Cyclobacteriaceae bacterium]|nr:response regulator [Cyclobacteriaceae bacterium]MCH8515549.1 response regulator [Cyclobacteriaceae bacterium]